MGLDFCHGFDEGRVGFEIAVIFPFDRHFLDASADARGPWKVRGDVSGVAALLVVGEDFFEVVHAVEVVATADAVAVALDFDHVKHVLRGVWPGFELD